MSTAQPATAPVPAATADPAGAGGDVPVRARWCLGTRLLVTGALAWALFLLAHILLTGRWWFWLVVEAIPPVTLVAVPVLLLALTPLARPARRPLSVLLLVSLGLGVALAGVNPRALAGSGGPVAAGDLKIFSWNTDIWTMHKDPDDFYAFLRAQDADVYLLQEYLYWTNGPVPADDLARVRAAFPGYHLAAEGELLTISRLPIVATYPRPGIPREGTDWYWRGNKAQRVDVLAGGRTLSIYNVHLFVPIRREMSPLAPEFYRFAREQYGLRQAEYAALREDVAGNPNPVLIAGDFNSPWLGSLVRLGSDLRRHDPTDGSVLPTSWPTVNYRLPRLWRLDWLFSTEDVRVTRYRFVPNPGLSDHLAQELYVSPS